MELSRRDALRAGGALVATGGVAGCIEERVTNRETRVRDGTTWALHTGLGTDRDQEAFEEYVASMADRYGDSGVWGVDGEPADGFEGAYVQRLALPRQAGYDPTGSHSSLDPEEVDPDTPMLFVDACVSIYDLGDDRHRYWLWVAADGDDGRLAEDVSVAVLGLRIGVREGLLADAAELTGTSGEAQVSLDSPPSGTFPLQEETSSLDSTSQMGEDGFYAVDWNGDVEGVQSINAVCEEERSVEHDFLWSIAAGYTHERTV